MIKKIKVARRIAKDAFFNFNKFIVHNFISKIFDFYQCCPFDLQINCSDIISPYQKMTSKVFPLVLPIWTNLWVFFKIPKIQKSYNIHAIFLRVFWWSKRWKRSLKSQKTRFFQASFQCWKKLQKNVFFEILRNTSIFLIITLLAKI